MAEEDPDRRHFAGLLKAFREARGLSRAELGALAGYAESTIKSFETGQRPVYAYHARHFDEAFELDGIFEHEASRFGKAGYSAAYGAFIEVMQEADDLYWFEHSTVPGLFQTEGYARAILSVHPGVNDDLVNERVAARLGGQAVLDRPSRLPRVWVFMDEVALRRRVGDAAVMHVPVDASRDTIARVDDEQWKVPARTGARALTAVPTEGPA
jgi:transcriptional regulator with XRE-family HTH domain